MSATQIWIASRQLDSALTHSALIRQEVALRVLVNQSAQAFSGIGVSYGPDGKLDKTTWAQVPITIDHSFIDDFGLLSGEVGTIFAWNDTKQDFTRITTNIKKDDGSRAVGTDLGRDNPVRAAMLRKETYMGEAVILGKPYLTIYQPILSPNSEDVVGVFFVGIQKTNILQAAQAQIDSIAQVTLISLAASLAILFFFLGIMLRPLKAMSSEFGSMAEGDFSQPISGVARRDELGFLAQKAEKFRAELASKQSLELEAVNSQAEKELERAQAIAAVNGLQFGLNKLAAGDLTYRLNEAFSSQYEPLRDSFNHSVENLAKIIAKVAESTSLMQNRGRELRSASENLSKRSETQAATLEETVAALTQISDLVKDSAKDTTNVAQEALMTRKEAETSREIFMKAAQAMKDIETSSAQINQIINLIEDIAFQTNLLSLNAGVEAARAGEAGRGFAIVASEVGALAQRSSVAAKEINSLVVDSSAHVVAGVALVHSAGEALTKILGGVSTISDLMDGIATRAAEQSIGLNEANLAVGHLDRVTQENAAMAEQVNAAVEHMRSHTDELLDSVSIFTTDDVNARPRGQMVENFAAQAFG